MTEKEYRMKGTISIEELEEHGLLPPIERMREGPKAIAECPEMIPCNICVDACPFKAITMKDINSIPKIDWNKCTGCGNCVLLCPGLAIFLIDLSDPKKAKVTLPHELLPTPKKGQIVTLLGRDGKKIGKGRVTMIREQNRTYAITVETTPEIAKEARAIWPE